MRRDSRLSGVLHVLLHMAEANGPVTSETMAKMMQTNPVVIRRILGGLREQGYVTSEKGHGGGWQLACDLETVTLYDIYSALDHPAIFSIGNRSESPDCLVEKAVNGAMNESLEEAENLLLARFKQVSLAQLSRDVHHQVQQRAAPLCQENPLTQEVEDV